MLLKEPLVKWRGRGVPLGSPRGAPAGASSDILTGVLLRCRHACNMDTCRDDDITLTYVTCVWRGCESRGINAEMRPAASLRCHISGSDAITETDMNECPFPPQKTEPTRKQSAEKTTMAAPHRPRHAVNAADTNTGVPPPLPREIRLCPNM